MMKLLKYCLFFLIIGCVSCETDKNQKNNYFPTIEVKNEERQLKENEKHFEIELFLKVLKDDIFECFYTTEGMNEGFSGTKKIRTKVFGSVEFQKVTFSLPKNIFPSKFRLDIGENYKQDKIYIKDIIIKYNGNSIEINSELISAFFSVNRFLKYDETIGVFITSEINEKWDPFIVSSALLNKKIEIEL
ncbi:hypothetical protein [Thalassobellus suaedae]|uniref:Lipoprotein n=1 Tax=Thalassobellus suaedae TaxID=3074124 RepID=A0ABY9XRP1_9FLAO|nr:hypothetical protein RHP51_16110 [Flavobacteriaceae bacterium HL-DH14]